MPKEGQSYSSVEKLIIQSVKNPTKCVTDVDKRKKAYYDNITKTTHGIFKELTHCIEKGFNPAADEVQKVIKKHHAFMGQTHDTTREVYEAMAQLYAEHPEFRKQLDPFHPDLATFMAEGMRLFADQKLS